MNWDSIQTDAKTKGHLVFAMDQARGAGGQTASTGHCASRSTWVTVLPGSSRSISRRP